MSKSLNNYIGIADQPDDMFGKIMSVSDELMWRYYELLSFRSMAEINRLKQQVDDGLNPRDVKVLLAEELIERFHDKTAAVRANENFVARFRQGAMPDDMPEKTLHADGGLLISNLLKEAGLVASTSEALRMIKQGAVKLDGEKVEDRDLVCRQGSDGVYQVGKRRFARVRLV
jgi:tyrosyl-tRNA synthetase